MFTLVESCLKYNILDRPNLGCAMIIAACQEKGIKTTLIKGQTRYLKDMFISDSQELWSLIRDLKDDDLNKIGMPRYKNSTHEYGLKQFQDELKSLYQEVIVNKNPQHYFNVLKVEKLNNLNRNFSAVYSYYLSELKHNKIKVIERYVSEIIKSNPRYVGFSLEGGFGPLSRIVRKRIKELTGIPIIVGGCLTPFLDLQKLEKIFKEEYFDYLIVGAGERALPSLIEALENRKEPKGIDNVFYKQGGKIKGNNLGVVSDLDALPYPDYSQFDLDLYLAPERILPLQTARGCSWRKCAFCSHHISDFGNYNSFSVKRGIEIIQHLQNTYNCSHFFLNDEELPPRRAKLISEALLQNKLKVYLDIRARFVEGYNDSNLLRLMRKAGFVSINWGMESGCQRVLDLMNKGTKLSNISKILQKSSKSKIANLCFIFFGFPGETKEEAQKTVEFLEKHSADIAMIMSGPFSLDAHSPIGKNPKAWDVVIKKNGSFSNKSGMSREEAGAFYAEFIKEFEIGSLGLTADKLRYLLSTHNSRTLLFLISSHMLLSNKAIKSGINGAKLSKIFPVILGEIIKKRSGRIFQPVNSSETSFINQYYRKEEKVLDRVEEKIFILSDGILAIEDIRLAIYRDFEKKYSKRYIYKKCNLFYKAIFSKNLGLGFAKSWRPS